MDKSKLTKARKELEELYSGIPDDSVNLTFQDFAQVRQSNSQKKMNPPPDPIPEHSPGTEEVSPLARMPSLDFKRGLEGFVRSDHPVHNYQNPVNHYPRPHVFPLQSEDSYDHGSTAASGGGLNRASNGGGLDHGQQKRKESRGGHQISTPGSVQQYPSGSSPYSHAGFSQAMGASSNVFDDMSYMSGMSIATEKGGGRRRPGIPHSNICTVCCNYIYIFRHRCLVCGRAYCRQCVGVGMGEMSEGRKCIECLGRKFSQRYIQKAGQVGCCSGYPTLVKQQELKWAEKGPRKVGENQYRGGGGGGGGGMVSQSMNRPAPRSPRRPNNGTPAASSAPTSFVVSSAYSPYHSPISHTPF